MGLKSIWRSLTTGSNQSNLSTSSSVVKEEPLECVIREHKRDEHLKNLGMKRNKSIRKSIAKKLRKKDKKDDVDVENKENVRSREERDGPPPPSSVESRGGGSTSASVRTETVERRESDKAPQVHIETRTSIGSKIEGGTKVEVLTVVAKKEKELVGDTQPLPGHIANEVPRKMDKLRRSIRHSMRKRKESGTEMTRAEKWKIDEAAVRSGNCQFYVKYLGACEVFESRGMQVCEAAVGRLKQERRRTVRGTMYVSGDSIRLVDDDTKALIIDQTIEKVSFCAPDRNFERGFSYISRDGTTRRWMCHAFMAVGDTGERLSHAVGCAFGICLENKQKRDKNNVSVQYDSKESSFTRNGSFRVGTFTERLADPQSLKICADIPRKCEEPAGGSLTSATTKAVERPRPTEAMYQRQASFRGLGQISGHTPFKRNSKGQLSLRLNDLPSTRERRSGSGGLLSESPILEDIELPSSNLESVDLLAAEDPFTAAEMVAYSAASGTSTPALPGGDSSSNYSMSPPPSILIPVKLHKLPETPESEHNPWDNVPDQPTSPPPSLPPDLPSSLPPSLPSSFPPPVSSLDTLNILIPSSNLTEPRPQTINSPGSNARTKDEPSLSSVNNLKFSEGMWGTAGSTFINTVSSSSSSYEFPKQSSTSSGYNSPSSTTSGTSLSQSNDVWQHSGLLPSVLENSIHSSILEDPFDAEWAAIATRNYSSERTASRNPFLQDSAVKSFELHL